MFPHSPWGWCTRDNYYFLQKYCDNLIIWCLCYWTQSDTQVGLWQSQQMRETKESWRNGDDFCWVIQNKFEYKGKKQDACCAEWRTHGEAVIGQNMNQVLTVLTDVAQLTCLIGGHIKWHILLCVLLGQLWHAVNGLQQEAVVGVRLQVGHHHGGVRQADAARQKAYVGAAFLQAPSIWQDPLAQDVVAHILPATRFHGDGPLEEDAGLVDIGDGVTWSRGRAWEGLNEVKGRKANMSNK